MIEKVSLFRNKRDFFHFLILAFTLFALSISYEFYNYKELTKFDSQLVDATVLKQYTKTKLTKKGKLKTYQVLKLKSDDGFTFYSTASKKLQNLHYKRVQLEAWAGKISFYEYMHGFYCFSKILKVYNDPTLKQKLNHFIDAQHQDKNSSLIFQALFTAKQLPPHLQTIFSTLGISHLVAISGFHLSVLSLVLFFLIKIPYKFFQKRYFPYRSMQRDIFFIVSILLLFYLLFLNIPPSLLRAYIMLLIGFILYDRGIIIFSMQTLFVATLLILVLFPRLIFSLGLFLSLAVVFYIYLFLTFFKHFSKLWQFIFLAIWVYVLMLPYSLVLFGNFSLYHPLSILYSSLFTLFYPLSIALHILGFGAILDPYLKYLISFDTEGIKISLPSYLLYIEIALSLLSIYKQWFIYPLLSFSISILAYAFYKL